MMNTKKDLTKLEFAKAAKKRIEEIYDDVEVTMKTVTKKQWCIFDWDCNISKR